MGNGYKARAHITLAVTPRSEKKKYYGGWRRYDSWFWRCLVVFFGPAVALWAAFCPRSAHVNAIV